MQLGLFTPVFQQLSLPDMLQKLKRWPALTMLELGTGGWPGNAHLPLDTLLADPAAAQSYKQQIADAGFGISALSCHGNPVHPDAHIAAAQDTLLRRTIALAAQLGVTTVVTFSGCPGGGPDDRTPNWITTAWPPECATMLAWQWEQRLIPYWRVLERFAADHGVHLALEAHPGFAVYNPHTLLRLRAATGPALGINLDPSHLWWQGMDIPAVIEALGDAIVHVHAKDVALQPREIARNGVLDPRSFSAPRERSWLFRSVGAGHGELEWKTIAAALRLAGYDGVLSIEHEDALASTTEGLDAAVNLLERVILREPPVEAWWS